jgi:hypothetical protein
MASMARTDKLSNTERVPNDPQKDAQKTAARALKKALLDQPDKPMNRGWPRPAWLKSPG